MPLKSTTIAVNHGAASRPLPDAPAAPGGNPGGAPLADLGTVLPETVSAADTLRLNREKWGQPGEEGAGR